MKILNKQILTDLSLILLLSLSLRIVFLYLFTNPNETFVEDSIKYYDIAKYAAENGILSWESHKWPPLISFVIIPFIKIFNESLSIISIRFFMIFLSTLTCVILYFLALEITKNHKISILISFINCLYPFSIFFSGDLLTENLAALLICSISLFFIKFINKLDLKHLFISSFLMGLLALTRPSYLYLPIFLSFIIFFLDKTVLKKFFYIIILFLTFYSTLSPWLIKNYNQLNTFVPTTTRLGYGLFLSNNDLSSENFKKGRYNKSSEFLKIVKDSNYMHPVIQSEYLEKIAINNILNNKTAFIKACFMRFLNFFNPKPNPYSKFKKRDLVMIFFYTPILLFFLASFSKKKYSINMITLLTIILYATLSHIPFYGFPRFRFPIDSLIFIISINFIFEKIKEKKIFKIKLN